MFLLSQAHVCVHVCDMSPYPQLVRSSSCSVAYRHLSRFSRMASRGSPMPSESSGEELASARASVSKSAKKRRTNSTAPQGPRSIAASIAESASDSDGDRTMCYLCCKPLVPSESNRRFRGVQFHPRCYNAVRCYRRYVSMSDSRLDQIMLEQPDRFRAEVRPLVPKPGERRDSTAMETTRAKLKDNATYTKDELIEDQLLLNRRQFVKHMRDTENMQSSDAHQEFNYLLRKQPMHVGLHSGGEKKVAVAAPQRIRRIKGSSTTNKSIEQDGDGAAATSGMSPSRKCKDTDRHDRSDRDARGRRGDRCDRGHGEGGARQAN